MRETYTPRQIVNFAKELEQFSYRRKKRKGLTRSINTAIERCVMLEKRYKDKNLGTVAKEFGNFRQLLKRVQLERSKEQDE